MSSTGMEGIQTSTGAGNQGSGQHQPGPAPPKRMRVDPTGAPHAQSGRPNIAFQLNSKDKAHNYCRQLYRWFVSKKGQVDEFDFRFQLKVGGWMFNTFSIARVHHNNPSAERVKKFLDAGTTSYSFGNDNMTFDHKEALDNAKLHIQFADRQEVGNVTTVMSLWALFTYRFDDCRIMPSDVVVGKSGTITNYCNLSDIGIPLFARQHAVGINYPVSMQGALASSLGVMTILYNLLKNDVVGGVDYAKKWERAANNALAAIPDSQNIVTLLKGLKLDTGKAVLTALARILVFTGARTQHRWAFPPCYLNTATLVDVDFSSARALAAFDAAQIELKFPSPDAERCKQLYAMMCIGGMFEDIGVLKFMFQTSEWFKRGTCSDFLKKFLEKTKVVDLTSITFPKIHYYSGALGAAGTNLFASSTGPVNSDMVMKGYRIRVINDAMEAMLKASSTSMMAGLTVNEALVHLDKLHKQLAKDLAGKKNYDAGTTKWQMLVGVPGTYVLTDVDTKPTEVGVTYFHQQ